MVCWADMGDDESAADTCLCWSMKDYVEQYCRLTVATPVGWVCVDKDWGSARTAPQAKLSRTAKHCGVTRRRTKKPRVCQDTPELVWTEAEEAEVDACVAATAACSAEAGLHLNTSWCKSLATALRQRVRRSRKQARGCYVGMEFSSKLRLREAVAAMLLGVEQARQEVRGHAAKPVSPAATGAGRSEAENGDDEFSLSYVVPLYGRAWWPSSGARNKRAHALNGNTARRDQTRGTFPNQWNSCWLAATLQSLFAAGRVRQAVSSHVGCGAAACGMCLLRKTEAESRSAGAEVVLCQDWAKPLRAFGCPLGPQQDPAEFVAQLVGLLGPKWLQVAGVQRTEVKALVPQCSCYGANLVETSRITAAETCINLYLPDASSSAEQSLNDLLRDNTLSARASGQRCPLCLQDITQREQTTYGCEDVLVFNVVREHGRKPVRADKVTLPDRMWPDEANTEYELRAVVRRSGASADSGHYVHLCEALAVAGYAMMMVWQTRSVNRNWRCR
ncbi:unnamed protein product, partial [Effrenium voratum]